MLALPPKMASVRNSHGNCNEAAGRRNSALEEYFTFNNGERICFFVVLVRGRGHGLFTRRTNIDLLQATRPQEKEIMMVVSTKPDTTMWNHVRGVMESKGSKMLYVPAL